MTNSGRKEALAVLRVLRANRALLLGTNPGSQQKTEVQLFAEPPRSFAFDGVLRESGPCFQLCGLSRTRRLEEIVVRGPRHRRRFFNSLALVWRNFVSAGPSLNSKGKSPAVQSFRTTSQVQRQHLCVRPNGKWQDPHDARRSRSGLGTLFYVLS